MSKAGAGVIVALIIVFGFRFALRGKGNVAPKTAAYLTVIAVFWVIVTVDDPAAGAKIAGLFGIGIPALADAAAALLRHVA